MSMVGCMQIMPIRRTNKIIISAGSLAQTGGNQAELANSHVECAREQVHLLKMK